ncbi:MAG: carboxypeptidase-like regulatory domain-containing protein, partial [Bacteroidales bacterium]|nr:carboxypeptidase-like regulatory domain-containing protein [Bacteroidales bacterium]
MFLLMSVVSWAQNITIKGNVKDQTGEPVIGASVIISGTTVGTVTDIDGNFVLQNVAMGADVEVSFIGYTKEVVKVESEVLNVILSDDTETLEDVVVIGYGVQKKSVVTASIAKVSSDDLEGKTRLRADDALKGMAAGVNVTSSSGQPGSSSMIRIRGVGTINNSDPLYIIDGMPTDQSG